MHTRLLSRASLALALLVVLAACRNQEPTDTVPETAAVVILTEADGITAISRGDLRDIGFQVDNFASESMRLTQNGQAIPFVVENERLLFYGQASTSRTAAATPYILERGLAGAAIPEGPIESAAPLDTVLVTLPLEQNSLYAPEALATTPAIDPWFWQAINQGGQTEVEAALPAVADGAGELEVALWGFTEAPAVAEDHDLIVRVNGVEAGRIVWDGRVYHTAVLPLPAGALHRGKNKITLDNSMPGPVPLDIIYLDRLALRYNAPPAAVGNSLIFTSSGGQVALEGFGNALLALDVTDPRAPRRLTVANHNGAVAVGPGARIAIAGAKGFLEPVEVRPRREMTRHSPPRGADLVIIAADPLAPALTPLIEARQAKGLAVAVVSPAEIGDNFGGGLLTPEAITRFIGHALNEWPAPKPRYLLIVGDATVDYRGYANKVPANAIPAALVTAAYSGETVSDARLADVDGDGRADLAIGRWPFGDLEDVAALVERTLAYESAPAGSRALFAADATEPRFEAMASRLAAAGGFDAAAMALLVGPTPDVLLSEWNDDVWLATYIGHGSLDRWGKDALLTAEDIAGVTPSSPGAPIVLQWTCLSGLFAQPEQVSLSETLLKHPHGPVLLVGPTSLTLSDQQEPFATALTTALTDPAVLRAGDAFLAATRALDPSDPGPLEISDTFVLFGDPSARIVRP